MRQSRRHVLLLRHKAGYVNPRETEAASPAALPPRASWRYLPIVYKAIDAHGLLGDGVRFVYVALDEPHKQTVLAFGPGDAIERRARVLLLDRATGLGTDLVVSITEDRIVTQQSIDAANDGHVPMLDQEFEDIEWFLLESPEWLAAMRKRDLDPPNVRAVPLSAGAFGHEDEIGRRVVRVLAFYQYDEADLPWAHPIDGVVAYVDLTARRVTEGDRRDRAARCPPNVASGTPNRTRRRPAPI